MKDTKDCFEGDLYLDGDGITWIFDGKKWKKILTDLETRIRIKINEIKKDERLTYAPAHISTNAPLALIQTMLEAQLHVLETMLDIPHTKIPIKK